MQHRLVDTGEFPSTNLLPTLRSKILLGLLSFAVLVTAIVSQLPKTLSDFDQSFYLTIAYDLNRHGVFSNGVFDNVNSTRDKPSPGMFFVPGYPLVVLAAMKLDARFAKAAECSVTAVNQQTEASDCEPYATPVRVIHAALLALGVVAIAFAASLIFPSTRVFWITGVLTTAGLATEAFIFSYVMTESLTFSLYSVTMLFATLAWKRGKLTWWALTGLLLGLLCLTRPSFVVLIPGVLLLIAAGSYLLEAKTRPSAWKSAAVFVTVVVLTIGPWILRNHVSVGKWGLTEEYGSAVLIERFAYNDMTPMEFVTAFPYCTPGLGDLLFDQRYGRDSMHRFVYHTRNSFFHVGRGRRDMLVKEHGRLDPLIGDIVREEMRTDWWRHLIVSIPLAWCGLWAGWIVGLVIVPLFAWAGVRAVRKREPVLLLYAAPAIMMLGLHGAVANHYTRYNLILIGPLAAGAAWIISAWLEHTRARSQARAPES
jgi:4-amino-4-deoxy-L-arabinose transferase-like glycosyltransferase